jgi:hypothetical protein
LVFTFLKGTKRIQIAIRKGLQLTDGGSDLTDEAFDLTDADLDRIFPTLMMWIGNKQKNHYNQGIFRFLGVTETSTKLNTFMTISRQK